MAVKVDEAQQVDPGYVAIHESSAAGGPGPVIGVTAYIPGGTDSKGIMITLDRPLKDGETVWAMLHTENNGNHTYDGASIDLPTVSTHCGNPKTGNISAFPMKINFPTTAGQGGTTAPTPRAPSTGTGTAANNHSETMVFVALAILAALLTAGTAATFAYQRRRG